MKPLHLTPLGELVVLLVSAVACGVVIIAGILAMTVIANV